MSDLREAAAETQHDVSWDDICVNPHESFLEEGRQEGHQAGLERGYRDGYQLGKAKAVEFGIELGFIRGFLNVVASPDARNRSSRIDTQMDELRTAIDEFCLSLDEIFASDKHRKRDTDVDIAGRMQRIRAKFKLVAVQLRLHHFSLKQVMQSVAESKGKISKQEEEEITDQREEKEASAADKPFPSDW